MKRKVEFTETTRCWIIRHEDGTRSIWKYQIEFDPQYQRPYRGRILNAENQVICYSDRSSIASIIRYWAGYFRDNLIALFRNDNRESHFWLDDDERKTANTERAA